MRDDTHGYTKEATIRKLDSLMKQYNEACCLKVVLRKSTTDINIVTENLDDEHRQILIMEISSVLSVAKEQIQKEIDTKYNKFLKHLNSFNGAVE